MKIFVLIFTCVISATAAAKELANRAVEDNNAVAPSADFIELTEAYQNRPKISPENNAFIYLVGISAPNGSDPMTFGGRVIDWSNKKIANGGKNDSPKPAESYLLGKDYDNLMEKISCKVREPKLCALGEHQASARKLINVNAALLKRRQTLLAFPDYHNTMTIDLMTSFPYYGGNIRLQQLGLMNLWLNREDYQPEKIKQTLQKDYDFRIKQSANAVTLIEKMIALAGLQNNYYWLNEILKSVDSDTATALTPRYLHEPIHLSALSMRMAYIGELQFFMSLFKPQNADEEFNPVVSQLSENEKQHLFNHQATLLSKLIFFSELPDYQTRLKQLETNKDIQQYLALMNALDKKTGGKWSEFAFGDTLFEQFVLSIAKYIERPYQLIAIQKAVNVLQEIRRKKVRIVDIPEFLQQPEQHNPLTKEPFSWNESQRQIEIKTMEGQVYYFAL